MVRKILKKRKDNQNKIKPSGRKRKIFATIALVLNLLFGKSRLSSSQSPSPNFGNQEVHQRLIDDREFNLFEENDRQVILAKADGNPVTPPTNRGPSNFPTPPSGGRPSRPVYVPKYRTAPKTVNPGLGAGANPAGAGGGGGAAEFDDQCPIPENQKSQESKVFEYDSRSNAPKKKKQSAEQCQLEEEFKKDKKYGEFTYKLDKNGNPILRVETKTGSEVLVTYDKALEKYYHQDVYNLETPKNFDSKEARSLKPKDRVEYLKKTVPRDKVIEFQIANAKSLSTENLLEVPGFIGAQKEPGSLYINKETGQVHFVNARTNTWRTTVIKTRTGLINLAKNNFHLFPNAGK
mgnify:CR=1 FL=1